jgi:hypothetical protein
MLPRPKKVKLKKKLTLPTLHNGNPFKNKIHILL